jgi:1,2-diacylglycerol 3-beta-galactosyltransferase
MGPLGKMALAISRAQLDCEVAVVCGRNEKLRRRLQATRFNVPMHVYGFAKNMPELLSAADVLVTKAGPGTINEAFIVGRPILIYSHLPGQEAGNVAQVVEEGAGYFTPTPEKLVEALRGWLGPTGERARLQAAANARKLARPHATAEILDVISEYLP